MSIRFRRGACVGLLCTGVLGSLMACGPSFHAIHEGNARFEHCYALEERPQPTMHDKADCWRDWSEHYTYGQTRDRIQYATARYVALSQAPHIPTDEALMMAAPGETRVSTITAPAPTNAFAPPPKVLEPTDAGPMSSAPDLRSMAPTTTTMTTEKPIAASSVVLPNATCTGECQNAYRVCSVDCGADAGTSTNASGGGDAGAPTCRVCQVTYKSCMRGCFK